MTTSRRGNRPPVAARNRGSTRRAQQAARRVRRRWIGWATAGGVLLGVVALIIVVVAATRQTGSTTRGVSVGASAPDGSFTTVSGKTQTVASLRGRPTLVWFVATWCSSCQAGTQAMAQQIGTFDGHGVRVVELEMADDLGEAGPSISDFGTQLAGPVYTNPDWTWGVASTGLTTTYDPAGDLDIYYLVDASGHITYINSSPGSTMSQLLAEVATVSTYS